MILLIGGTGEARLIAAELENLGLDYLLSLATDYGRETAVVEGIDSKRLLHGRLNAEQFIELIRSRGIFLIIDAGHPHAAELHREIDRAVEKCEIELIRWQRKTTSDYSQDSRVKFFSNTEEMLPFIKENSVERILMVAGNSIAVQLLPYLDSDRVWVRTLPWEKSICELVEKGLSHKHIIAWHGAMTYALNLAILKELEIDVLITKDSGDSGGFKAKVDAALDYGCRVMVLKAPEITNGKIVKSREELKSLLLNL